MQKIEKWRLQHLSQVLERIAWLLTEGANSEWGNVFRHFQLEAVFMTSTENLKLETLLRFVSNVKNCFSGSSSFKNVTLSHKDSENMKRLNQEFLNEKAELREIIQEIEDLSREYKH